jgi:predicted enzyme related to lactoylglutathione lyase
MFETTHAFSGFSVDDIETAKQFYGETLGIKFNERAEGIMLEIAGTNGVFVYKKGEQHVPASFTILNFPVDNIDEAVNALKAKGVTFESYPMTDENNIARGKAAGQGPDIAWFKDPAGNVLSVLEGDE